jgi:hypothetical protein
MTYCECHGTAEAHSAWLDALEGDEKEIVFAPVGWRYTLAMVATTKRALAGDMPPAMRLQFLQHLEKMAGAGITPEAIARVEPACDVAMRVEREAHAAAGPSGMLDILAEIDVWSELARLNPSLLAALRMCGHQGALQ